MRKPLVVLASLVVSVPALFSADKPAVPPKPTVVAKPEEKPSLLSRMLGRKPKTGEQPAAEEKKTKPETKTESKPEGNKPKTSKAETTKPETAKPEPKKESPKSKPKTEAEKPKKNESKEKPAEKPVTKPEAKPEESGKTDEPKAEKPADEPKTEKPAEEPKTEKPADEPKAEKPESKPESKPADSKADGKSKKGKKATKPAPAKLDTTGMDDSTKFKTVKAVAQEDESIKALKAKADSAIAEDEAHEASVAYNRALFRKIREIEPSLEGYANKLEGAMMKRLNAEKKGE